jgi:hypothetical protein
MAKQTPTKPAAKSNTATAIEKAPQNTAIEMADVNALLLATAGIGSENVQRDDLAIPRIAILQSNSPQVKKGDPKKIAGAEEGDFLDNVQQLVLAKGEAGFLFIPAAYRRSNLEWVPQSKGGGFVADHGRDDSILAQCTKDGNNFFTKAGNEIVATAEFVGIILDNKYNYLGQAAISLAKTQLKKAKKVNTIISTLQVDAGNGRRVNPAMAYSVFHCTSVPETNDKGSWMGWKFERQGDTIKLPNGVAIFQDAIKLAQAVNAGTINVAAPDAAQTQEGDSDTL